MSNPSKKPLTTILCISLLMTNLLAGPSARADQGDDINKVCGSADFSASSTGVKADDCKAAWAAYKAKNEELVTGSVWAAVFGVCTTGCVDTALEKSARIAFLAAQKTADAAQLTAKTTAATAATSEAAAAAAITTATAAATATATTETASVYTALHGAAGFIAIATVTGAAAPTVALNTTAATTAGTSAAANVSESTAATGAATATPNTSLNGEGAIATTAATTATTAGNAEVTAVSAAVTASDAANTAECTLATTVAGAIAAAPAYADASPLVATACADAGLALSGASMALTLVTAKNTAQAAWLAAKNTALDFRTACYIAAGTGLVTDAVGSMVLADQLKKLAPDASNSSLEEDLMGGAGIYMAATAKKNQRAVCLTAIGAGGFSTMRFIKADEDYKAANDNLKLAKDVVAPPTDPTIGGFTNDNHNYNAPTGKSVANTGGGTQAPGTKNDPANNDPCTSSNTDMKVSCAVAGDGRLSGVGNPGFQSAFQKASGQSLGGFLGQNHSGAGDAMMASMGGSSGIDPNQLAAVIAGLPKLDHNYTGQAYAGGGKGSVHAGAGDDLHLADMMKNFMPKKDGEDRAPAGSSETAFGKTAPLMATATAEDRKVSIFDRVTYRYGVVNQTWVAPTANVK